jgi:hypothetical protein
MKRRSLAQPTFPKCHLALQMACVSVLVAGCGGGGTAALGTSSGSPLQVQSVPLQTYITDNLATDYSKVWVSVEKITAVDSSGTEVTLFDATGSAAVINLSSLASVGQFMSTVTIPVGVYSEVRVTLANSILLVSLDGSTTVSAKLAATGSDFIIHITGISVDPSSSGQLILDFNLARFTYDPSSGLVTPVVEVPPPVAAFSKFVAQQATVNGIVQSVDAANGRLVVNDPRLGDGVVIILSADAVIVDEASNTSVPLAGIPIGARVEVSGMVSPGATTADPVTVIASVVHLEASNAPVAVQTIAGAGTVSSVSGDLVSVALNNATFLPASNSIVVDVHSAQFLHGQLSNLTPGVTVAFNGSLIGTGASIEVLASDIDIQGAPSQNDLQNNPEQTFTAVNGAIGALNSDGSFTVGVTRADGPVVVPGVYTVDASHATYLKGNASCLAVGSLVQAVGSLVSTTLTAKYMNVANCAGQIHSEPAPLPPPPTPSASAPAPSASGPH